VDRLLASGGAPIGDPPPAVIVPHAGYRYSGPVAASAYRLLRAAGDRVRRVALLGPAHFVPLGGAAVPGSPAWDTPIGTAAIDPVLREVAAGAGAVIDDGPHEPEHALEVQLPFLMRLLGAGTTFLPVAVGRAGAEVVAGLVEALWGEVDLVVVSTDLSHYLDVHAARLRDRRTADAVLARRAEAIGPEDACGLFALRGIVQLARVRDLPIRLLDLRTSADTLGDPDRVVGYGAFAVGA
jgi:AmmeMemoRadiSam system protein B